MSEEKKFVEVEVNGVMLKVDEKMAEKIERQKERDENHRKSVEDISGLKPVQSRWHRTDTTEEKNTLVEGTFEATGELPKKTIVPHIYIDPEEMKAGLSGTLDEKTLNSLPDVYYNTDVPDIRPNFTSIGAEIGLSDWVHSGKIAAISTVFAENFQDFANEDAGTIHFNKPNGEPMLSLHPNGNIFVNGRLAENDKEVVDGMREFLRVRRNF